MKRGLLLEKIKSPAYVMEDGTHVYINKFGREIKYRISIKTYIGGIQVTNLGVPTNNNDAVTIEYVQMQHPGD